MSYVLCCVLFDSLLFQGVGKTCLLMRFAFDTFYQTFITTIGIDFKIKIIELDGMHVKLQIWDTAGQEQFRNITMNYFKGAHGVVLVYDVSDRETFDNIRHWLSQIKDHADEHVNVVLVGNKSDVPNRQISFEEGKALATEYNLQFFETSAKDNTNVDQTFEAIARETKTRLLKYEKSNDKRAASSDNTSTPVKLTEKPSQKKGKCC